MAVGLMVMPPEWASHRATWLAWPHNRSDWPGKFRTIPWVFAEVARHLCRGERVRILVADAAAERSAQRVLRQSGVDLTQVSFYQVPTDRSWTRDTGAIFVKDRNGQLVATDWRFNAWAKYPDWLRDDRVASRMARALEIPVLRPSVQGRRIVLEGGAIDVDGEGTLLATEECLLDEVQARNPGLGRPALETALGEYLGIRKVIWLGRGIVGDDTHGHVDDVARFVGPGRVVLACEDNPADENHPTLEDNLSRLEAATDARGRRLEVVRLPMPTPVFFGGRRLPASYVNFYIGNESVLVPTFNDERDRIALGVLTEVFPGRRIVGIHAVDLVWGLGTLHCMTQQEPSWEVR